MPEQPIRVSIFLVPDRGRLFMMEVSESTQGGTLPVRLRFNLFWAVVHIGVGILWLALPVFIFAKDDGKGKAGEVALASFAMCAFVCGPVSYFGIRGLSRRDQIMIGPEGLSGPLLLKDGGTLAWHEIADMRYVSRGFLEVLKLRLQDGRKIVVRDLSQLGPFSLLELSEATKRRIETGVLVLPKPIRWWQTTWATILFVLLATIVLITAANMFGLREQAR